MKLSTIVSSERVGRDEERAAFADIVDYALFADQCGLNPFLRERHFADHELTASNSMMLAAYLAPQMKNCFLGFGIIPITYHHPVHLAEDMNILDHLTKGKVVFGLGGGYGISPEPIGFGMTLNYALKSASNEIFDITQQLWAKKPEDPPLAFKTQSYSGHLLNRIVPGPYGSRPKIIRTASKSEALLGGAKAGLPVFVGQYGGRDLLEEQISLYLNTLGEAGHSSEIEEECRDWMTARFANLGVVLADTTQEAEALLNGLVEETRGTFKTYMDKSMAEMKQAAVIGGQPAALSAYFQKVAPMDESERIKRDFFAGTPDDLLVELKALQALGLRHVIISVAGRWCDPKGRAIAENTMQLIASDVMPKLVP
jgi:alkanesulfonate monooxygenase SsuD/methylene tetrahydromethanopterin reductase-like flavin-dependent oxidoreductase (luciferase family)